MNRIAGASFASLLGLLICFLPVVAGAWYAVRPAERVLSLMRPLTLASIFSALCSFLLALLNGCNAISTIGSMELNEIRRTAAIMTEGLAPVAASFACLTVAWACVAIGLHRDGANTME